MKYKIGVFGSNAEELGKKVIKVAEILGRELAKQKVILLTGGSSGLPYIVAREAAKRGAQVWGFPPVTDIQSHKKFSPKDDLKIYKKLIYVPKNFIFSPDINVSKKFRNVVSTANCDAGIIISGRWGTLNEFTNLYDFGKVIGVLTNTGGVAGEIPLLNKKIYKKSKAKVIFSTSPKQIADLIIKELDRRKT
jgi:uncharacterized protein (TIGR00725 family)